ncbi:hypothetical protein, partial [Sansalvadorimonas verongulae]|uniref:hypothetical protein n=1 Tax=Sansalvadorimonas verongulae TaxID=2172824 RepID=UPI0018AD2BE0
NLKAALDIFNRLRTRATGGRVNIRSDDKEIELGLASIFIDTEEWEKFDELQLGRPLLSGFETCLCLSLRYFQELMNAEKILPKHSILLGKAFNWAALALEGCGGTNASCLSQLGHCFRLLSFWPKLRLQELGIEEEKEQEFRRTSELLFGLASDLEPHRQELKKDDQWRQKERKLLALMTGETLYKQSDIF